MPDYRNMYGPPLVDFSGLGQLPKIYNDAADQAEARQLRQRRQQILSEVTNPNDFQAIGSALLRAGDWQSALAAAQLAQTQSDRKFNQGIAERQISLQEKSRAPSTVQVKDPNTGNETTMMWDATQNRLVPIQGVSSGQPNNPYAATGKFTNEEGKAAGFADRMFEAEKELGGLGGAGGASVAGTSIKGRMLEKVPVGLGNYAQDPQYQSFAQARDNFINAQLRRESGAAISPKEYENADKQYFPVPGDEKNPNILRQKAQNRRDAIEAMAREGGRSYSPKYVFGESGLAQRQRTAAPAQGGGVSAGGVSQFGLQASDLKEGKTYEGSDGKRYRVVNGRLQEVK